MKKILIAKSLFLMLTLLGAGCEKSSNLPLPEKSKQVVVEGSGNPFEDANFVMKLKCKPFLDEVEQNNQKLKDKGVLPLVPYVCYSRTRNTCISVQGYIQEAATQWEIKDLLTGEVLDVIMKESGESGSELRKRVEDVKSELRCVE